MMKTAPEIRPPEDARHARSGRKFLVVVDGTPECRPALHFAARRARSTSGGVTLLCVLPRAEFQHWVAVGDLMREEALVAADEMLQTMVADVHATLGGEAEVVIREGTIKDQVLELIEEDPNIGVLVLGAGTSPEGPGPLVSSFAGQLAGSLPIPVTVVPGNLTIAEIDALT